MTEEQQGQRRSHKVLWRTIIVVAIVLAALIAPPMVSISRYKSQIVQLISVSLGRPVRLSSVEARLLPRPGFILSDLTVEEDPRYGAEPVLHANQVVAKIGLFSLWRGRLEISAISVDEASLNIVRNGPGEWNLAALFRSAAASASGSGQRQPLRFPSFTATNSRINFKNGVEKLPFSLVDTDFSFTRGRRGLWSFSLRGQPARTDLVLDQADTGTLRMEGSVEDAAELRRMPLHLKAVWKEAQLGQLSRLLAGSDPGWRGDLTGEAQLDGTAAKAEVKVRLSAKGVHREEFAPAEPLDFDAHCSATVQVFSRSFERLACDSPIGRGRIHVAGERPLGSALAMNVELDKLPAQAVLDLLRTVRSDFGKGMKAEGDLSGKIGFSHEPAAADKPASRKAKSVPASVAAAPMQISGGFTVENLKLSSPDLSSPIQFAKIAFAPASTAPGQPPAISATVALPAGAPAPLNLTFQLGRSGYRMAIHGQAALARAREFARVGSLAGVTTLNDLAGGPVSLDLTADGPWLPKPQGLPMEGSGAAVDRLAGVVNFRNANWKPAYLVNALMISSATLRLGDSGLHWDPIDFTYGPVKGTATLDFPAHCEEKSDSCLPEFHVDFATLDASALQAALLGARKKGTVVSELIAHIHPAEASAWPEAKGSVHAALLALAPTALKNLNAELLIHSDQVEISMLEAGLLGGAVHGSGRLLAARNERDKPAYSLQGEARNLSAAALGQLLGARFSGGPISLSGQLDASGYTGDDLAASARGGFHFEWKRGSVSGAAQAPPALSRFDGWSGEAVIAGGQAAIKESQVVSRTAKQKISAAVTLQLRPKLSFAAAAQAKPKP